MNRDASGAAVAQEGDAMGGAACSVGRWLAIASLLGILLSLGACGESAESRAVVRRSIVAGLLAGSGGALHADQVATFQLDLRGNWAVAYDPADPPGCSPGGLVGTPDGPPIPERPCSAYILHRRKTRWDLELRGVPGALRVPEGVPEELGSPGALEPLGS
jgi:hypothetical protein